MEIVYSDIAVYDKFGTEWDYQSLSTVGHTVLPILENEDEDKFYTIVNVFNEDSGSTTRIEIKSNSTSKTNQEIESFVKSNLSEIVNFLSASIWEKRK